MTDVIVDTSVWVDHFRNNSATLVDLLRRDAVLIHPMIIGELACGTPPSRNRTLLDLSALRLCPQASLAEVMVFIERERLFGLGCGLVDLSLLASTMITPDSRLWTMDKRLSALASRFEVAFDP